LTLTRRETGKPEPIWDIGLSVCTRCADTDEVQHRHAADDEKRRKAGIRVSTAGRLYTARFMGYSPEGR
jgi:hypothetical protein